MTHLFICSTPLQLINTINIKLNILQKEKVVLYVLDHSNNYKELFEQAINSNIFFKVKLLKTKYFNNHWTQKYLTTRYLVKSVEYLFYNLITHKYIVDDIIYDKFWVSFMDRSSWLVFLSYKKKNPNIKLFFFEDGLGSYQLLSVQQNKMDKIFSHLLGLNTVFEEIEILYVYEPNLVINTLHKQILIKRIPKINDKTKKVLNKVFKFNLNELEVLKCKYIFFDSPFIQNEIKQQQMELIDFFINSSKSFCIKLHPRSNLVVKSQFISSTTSTIEMICMNTDVSPNVFISIISTVGISPKIMFDQTPIVIYLYKVIGLDRANLINKEYFEFIENISKKYDRIFIPKTLEELKKVLKYLKEEEQNDKK